MRSLICVLTLVASPTLAVTCENVTFENVPLTHCTVDATTEDLRLFHSADGDVLGSFARVAAQHGPLSFAMNAGMYHPDRAPVGLYVENGDQVQRLITSAGPGNFGLVPNGVLCLADGRAEVFETGAFAAQEPDCRDATQSGPMLVIDGALHPRFIPGSTSAYVRNGVGTSADGLTAHFVISNAPVNFDTFGRYFRDVLETPDALYFDGKVSKLHAPALGRSDVGFAMGPIIGVIAAP